MNRKVLGFFVTLVAIVMLALPMSTVSAAKPEKFVSVTFYGYPGGGYNIETQSAGNNIIMTWTDTEWVYCWDPFALETMAVGEYNGHWIIHSRTGAVNARGVFEMEVTNWGAGETGNLVVLGIGDKLKIINGTIGGKKVHGAGTSEELVFMAFYKYEFTIHFDP